MSILQQRRWMQPKTAGQPGSSAADDRFVTADGTRLFVRVSGPENAQLTVVFVHGWTQHNECWNSVADLMPDDLRVLRYDHRGHGASDPARPGTRTLEQLADDLAELIADRVPDGPLVLVGHSMGGMTLMALAERHPELVDRRVAAAAFVATSSGDVHRTTLGLRGPLGRAVPRVEPMLRALLERRKKGTLPGNPVLLSPAARWLVFGRKAKQEHVLQTVRESLSAHPGSIGGFMDAMFAHDRRVVLCALKSKPTIVLTGDRDRFFPISHARTIAAELPAATFVLYPGAGHMLMHERTVEVATRIRALITAAARSL